ncbi:F-box only protein 5 [Trichomycterus rosablanca]|uniref:F-box only protein 5 n=1 Tax=Trichomycterus rosablanca TaxID=2290929 RepID=UPI002F35FE8D
MKCLARSRSTAASRHADKAKAETCAELKGQKKTTCAPSLPSSISRRSLPAQPKGPHNKENCEEKPCSVDVLSDDEQFSVLSSSSLVEDSGYLSLHNSQLEHDADLNGPESVPRSPEDEESSLSSNVQSCSKSACLPVLKFQNDVCKALKKSYRKHQSYDWSVVSTVAENHGLHNVIGAKMGLDYVDIFCGLLKKDMKHILTRILSFLGDCDLINCKKVSRTWRRIICQDKQALQRCREAEPMLKDTAKSVGSLSRDFGLSRVVFSCLQSVASSTPIHRPTKKTLSQTDSTLNTPKSSRIEKFQEAAKSLKAHEALRSCRLCGSPARFDSAMKRAVCTRVSCAFDFCSVCQSEYHGSTPCQRGILRTSHCETAHLAGSTRSKRSVRRL